MTPAWLIIPPRPGPVLLDPDVTSDCCGSDVLPLVRWKLDGERVEMVESVAAVCRECRRRL